MKKTQKAILFSLTVLGMITAHVVWVHACDPTLPSEPGGDFPDPNRTDGSVDPNAVVTPQPEGPGDDDNEPACGIDPVLLNTGEFLFSRTDSIVGGGSVEFPIVRSYRSKPVPLSRHLIDDGEIKQIVTEETSDPNKWYYDPAIPQWTSWGFTCWDEPIARTYFKYQYVLEIKPIILTGDGYWATDPSPYPGGYKMIDATQDPDIESILPIAPNKSIEGKAYRFRLWTGQSYLIEFRDEKYLCPWECLCDDYYPVTDCPLHVFGTPYPDNFLPYPNPISPYGGGSSFPYHYYRCGFWENDCVWADPTPSYTIITIPEIPISWDVLPCPLPSPNMSPLSRSIENKVSLTNWTPGWDMGYNIYLQYCPDPNSENGIDEEQVLLYPGNGNEYSYQIAEEEHPVYGEVWTCPERNDFLKKWNGGTYTLYRKENRYWQFNTKGYIDYISDKGQAINFVYDPNTYGMDDTLRLDYIEDNYGRRTNLIYSDPNGAYPGNLLKIVDNTGREWAYDYYTDGNLKKVTDPNGYTETYEYDDWGRLTTVRDDANDIWLDNDYDADGRVYQQTLGGTNGPVSTITYNTNNRVVTDANGFDETVVLNDDGYTLSKVTETDDATVTTLYERDDQNKLTKITYPELNGYDLVYDPNGNLTSVAAFSSYVEDPNLTYTLTYTDDDWGFLKTVTDPRGNTTTYTYDYEDQGYGTSDGLLMKITYPEVPTDTEPNTPEIVFTYDPNNLIETIASPDGIVLKYEYWQDTSEPNSLGQVKKVILDYGEAQECLNIEYTFDYDETGRVVDVNDPLGNTTTLTYNLLDLLSQVEDPDGNIIKMSYNADRKLSKVERAFDGGWQTFAYGYNIMAKLNRITDSLGNEITLDYDDRFQVKEVTDSNTNATKKRYNARRLIKEIIDAEDGSTTFDYDDNGRLSVVTDAEDANTIYDYDGYGRLEYVTYADNSFEEYGYDDNGNLTLFTNRANETITFGYDALNRLIDKKVGTDPNIVLTYDIAGRLVEVTQSTKEMTFDYDRLGRLESTTDQNNNTVGSDYDDMGRRSKLTYPDNSYITYDYDASGRLEYIRDEDDYPIVHYVYDELSRTAQVNYYRGTSFVGSMTYDFEDANSLIDDDLGNRIERIDYSFNTSSNHHISYTYDSVGNVTSADVGGASGYYGWTYGYDKVYQVTDANQILTPNNRKVDISYDSVFNRTSWYDSLLSLSMSYEDNAVNRYSKIMYNSLPDVYPTYDNRGNCMSWGNGITCSYNEENRLVSAGSVSYTYDLLGRRLSRSYGGTTTWYVWDGAHIIAEYTGSSLTKKYIYGPGMDNPIAMVNVNAQQNETWYYYFTDALGSVRLLTDGGGTIKESYAYDPYGQPYVMTAAGDGNWLTDDASSGSSSSSSYGNPYMFTARRWDSDAGIYYYRFRDYAPELGRFVQTDPAGYIDTMNLYAYCANNPVNWIDPWGLCKEDDIDDDTSARYHPSTRPPAKWPDPGREWKWNKEGYYEKRGKRKHWHPEGPGNRHGKGHWDYEDRKGRHTGREFETSPGNWEFYRIPIFLWVVPRIIMDAAFPDAPGSVFNERERQRRGREA